MSGRTLLSRPRTRIYDANYNISQNYYRPALDRLDRKYSGRSLSESRSTAEREASIAQDVLDRHDRAFANEDLSTSRRRAEKHISESNLFDSRGGRIARRALDLAENDINEETAASINRIRAQKKLTFADDVDLESTISNISSRRLLNRSEKLLESVGINENSRRILDEDIIIKRRALKVSADSENGDFVKWSPLAAREDERDTAATIRAKQSRDRILDLENEMADLAERQAVRERRAARMKQLVADTAEETRETASAIKAVTFRSRRDQLVED